jgi:hypothetical protein
MSRIAWKVAAGLGLAHVVLLLVGVSVEQSPALGDPQAEVAKAYVQGSMVRIFTGGYLELLGFALFLVLAAFLYRALGQSSEVSAWAATAAFAAGVAYVAVTVAPGFAAGAAALYGAQHGADLATVTVVNDVRNFAYLLSLPLLALFTGGIGAAVLAGGQLPRWVGWSGLVVAVVLIAFVPGARAGLADIATMLWLVWFVGLAVAMLRRRDERVSELQPNGGLDVSGQAGGRQG